VRKQAAFILKLSATLPPLDLGIAPPLSVSPASATSAALARVLYRLWFGESAYEMRAADTGNVAANSALSMRRPMELLIGDEALMRKASFRVVIDLGEVWRELTDLPFVFAVWQTARRAISPYWRQKILEAAEIAQARMRIEPTYYLGDLSAADVQGHTIDLASYWKVIQYRLTPAHFRGLALFLAMVRALAPEAYDEQAVVCITRWESLGQSATATL
jgi:chorismate dehydratase